MIRIHSAKERRAAVLSRAIYCVMLHIVLIRCQRRLHVVSPRAFRLLKVWIIVWWVCIRRRYRAGGVFVQRDRHRGCVRRGSGRCRCDDRPFFWQRRRSGQDFLLRIHGHTKIYRRAHRVHGGHRRTVVRERSKNTTACRGWRCCDGIAKTRNRVYTRVCMIWGRTVCCCERIIMVRCGRSGGGLLGDDRRRLFRWIWFHVKMFKFKQNFIKKLALKLNFRWKNNIFVWKKNRTEDIGGGEIPPEAGDALDRFGTPNPMRMARPRRSLTPHFVWFIMEKT